LIAKLFCRQTSSTSLFLVRQFSSTSSLFQQATSATAVSKQSPSEVATAKAKALTVEDSLKDLGSIKWRTEWQGKRLYPHDQWPERDLVNFPPYKSKERASPVRWGFVPDSWFTFFYEKTGVTGPYLFFWGLIIHGFSREWIVLWYDFNEYIMLAAVSIVLMKVLGPHLVTLIGSWRDAKVNAFERAVQNAKAMNGKQLHLYEMAMEKAGAVDMISEARREILSIQLETSYRERLKQAYESVKRRLDYQMALQNARKDFERSNMINWITNEVKKAITQKQEQETMQQCLQQLKQIATQPAK